MFRLVSWIPYNIVKALQVASGWLSPDHSDSFGWAGGLPFTYFMIQTAVLTWLELAGEPGLTCN